MTNDGGPFVISHSSFPGALPRRRRGGGERFRTSPRGVLPPLPSPGGGGVVCRHGRAARPPEKEIPLPPAGEGAGRGGVAKPLAQTFPPRKGLAGALRRCVSDRPTAAGRQARP